MIKPTTSYFYNFISVEYEATDSERQVILNQFPPPPLPDSDEFFDIQSTTSGDYVKARLLLNDHQVALTKTNKQFLKMSFSNNFGSISAKMWDNQGAVERNRPLLESFSVFDIEGIVDEFNGNKSLTINAIKPCEENINPFSLLPYTGQSIEELTVELFSYLNELQSPFKEISYGAMNRFWGQFRIRPAAKGYHHNYLGGLLKHTVGLMRFARYILKMEDDPFQAVIKLITVIEKVYKQEVWTGFQNGDLKGLVWKDTIDHLYTMLQGMMNFKDSIPNYDLIMTSILYHDIGKLMEYDHAGKTFEDFEFLYPTADQSGLQTRKQSGITMDGLGVMVGHIPYGVLLLSKIIDVDNIPVTIEEIHHMTHCILCHHGLPEWGSCIRTPQTLEGYIIHIVDYLDSRYENSKKAK
ncbi:hydrolase [Niallia sp. XMNu-256]|uniref:hydrolase n=1 Tax=Niallia sp. XMNu-256 TaxID=3082444 RepID=UPI0030CB5B83